MQELLSSKPGTALRDDKCHELSILSIAYSPVLYVNWGMVVTILVITMIKMLMKLVLSLASDQKEEYEMLKLDMNYMLTLC